MTKNCKYAINQKINIFSDFYVEDESDNYRLHITGYIGTTSSDSLANQNNMPFTTKDRDNDN